MKKIVCAFMVFLVLTGCTPGVPATNQADDAEVISTERAEIRIPEDQLEVISASTADVKFSDEISVASGLLTDLVDLNLYHYIGFDGKDSLIIRGYDDFIVKSVNINTGKTTEIMDISTNKGHFIMAEIYANDWVIWSESVDQELYVGLSIGEDWAIHAANVKTKEIIEIDAEKESFPKDREFNAQPIGMSAQGDFFTYSCYESDESGVYEAIKVFNFITRELKTIATQRDESRGYSTPAVDGQYVVFSDSKFGELTLEDNIIYLYEIENDEMMSIKNPKDAALPVVWENYIVAISRPNTGVLDDSILIYDIKQKRWTQEISGTSPIYEDAIYPFDATDVQLCEGYLVWRSGLDDAFYVYDVAQNTFYELLASNEDRFLGYIFYFTNRMLIWAEGSINMEDEGRFCYVLLDK